MQPIVDFDIDNLVVSDDKLDVNLTNNAIGVTTAKDLRSKLREPWRNTLTSKMMGVRHTF